MNTIDVNKFSNRKNLDEHIKNTFGTLTEVKDQVNIQGTVEELRRYHLRHGQMCWGVQVLATDYIAPAPPPPSVPRGKQVDSKLNGVETSLKKRHAKNNKSKTKPGSPRSNIKGS